ncbi:MAG: sigma-70 family RNA polymerase sigma factor [Lautropia sp.]
MNPTAPAEPAASAEATASVDPLTVVQSMRPRLLRAAQRLLGSAEDAEDIVQDAWLRLHAALGIGRAAPPQDPQAWLVAVVTRLCIDRLRHAQRVRQIGATIPAELLSPASLVPSSPEERLAATVAARAALRVALAALSPLECAALLLVEVCGLDHRESARLLGRSEAANRQLLRRARRALRRRPRRLGDSPDGSAPAGAAPAGVESAGVESAPGGGAGDGAAAAGATTAGEDASASRRIDRCLEAIRSADHRALIAAVLRADAPAWAAEERIHYVAGPNPGDVTVLFGGIVLARVRPAATPRRLREHA